ncbi:hypothetical protein JIN84_11730 [Luteolibacter yonseiensis]|uniref:DUF4381 domain-containing protein n=1 Tax=Luteolibacter yonseiensis TaxID=1144680 RepID=A0A934R6G2_9BACT|nr:hypothetical protein [Luteolibacter yonseiensis]MBK1816285.1 hypothetical protein [Luteolibacter yonseiensis]
MFRSLTFIVPLVLLAGDLHAQVPAETEDIRGPKEVVEIPVPEKPDYVLWSVVGGGLLMVALGAFFWKKHARRQRLGSPHEVALKSLAGLESDRGALTAEAFADRAAETLRSYISRRFGMAAPLRTTEEFLHDIMRDDSVLAGQRDLLKTFLKSCDLAKFAGSQLNEDQRHGLVESARGFIRSTSDTTKP